MTLSRRDAQELLERFGVEPSRALGQNFVVDPNTVRRIARLAGVGPGDRVVEVGPGLGSLTLALVETGAEVVAVEVDRHLLPVLHETVGDRARILHADAADLSWVDQLEGTGWVLVANLPYNVATPLILDLLDQAPAIERMVVMVQREVADRLAAPPGNRTYGIPSVKVAYHGRAEVLGTVPPTVFVPRPRVESALVAITRAAGPASDADPAVLFRLVGTAFGQRRKMLRRSLRGLVDEAGFAAAGVAPDARPEMLDVPAWGRLAAQVAPR